MALKVFLFPTLLIISVSLIGCGPTKTDKVQPDGAQLAKQYCGTCHNAPAPGLLDKKTWQNSVLPDMGKRLGLEVYGGNYVYDPYDSSAMISFANWLQIVDYYTKSSPDKLSPGQNPDTVVRDWSIFELKKPLAIRGSVAKTMMAAIDTATKSIYTSNGITNYLYKWNPNLQITDSVLLPSAAVYANFFTDSRNRHQVVITCMGTMFPEDVSKGLILQFDASKKLNFKPDTIASKLPRPVQITAADLNKDGLTDWIVSGFGHESGGLYWYEQLTDEKYKQHILLNIPGATQSYTGDYNNDGLTDIMVLFAHGDESIRIFLNNGSGGFSVKKILSFPPVYGSSSFQLADMNSDGLQDILYTCGDNADLSHILKPYHGLYIYLNKGNFKYEQSYFYPINGCTKGFAADFDNDGDLDIATIALFADFINKPAEKFIYFKQIARMRFTPYSPPIENMGRWICMDAKDYDGDGDIDVVLGNFPRDFLNEKNFIPTWDQHLPIIVLRNSTIN